MFRIGERGLHVRDWIGCDNKPRMGEVIIIYGTVKIKEIILIFVAM